LSAAGSIVVVVTLGDDDSPSQAASPDTTGPFVESTGTGPIANQNLSTPIGNTPRAGSG
jgi:hypothetical protein